MIRIIVRDFDFLRDGVAPGDSCRAGAFRSAIHTLTSTVGVGIEGIAGKPIVTVACFIRTTIRIKATGLTIHIRAFQFTLQEAIFSSLFLVGSWEVSRSEEQVNQRLILTDSIGEHTTMITVVVDAPLHFNNFVRSVRGDNRITPVIARLIVVDTNSRIISTWSASTYLGFF